MAYRKKILVVEDNEINREILSGILSEDYAVLQAENGREALDILKEYQDNISLILLDVIMPVMDGYTFLDRVKKDPKLSLIPVIVMTQSNSEADELAALKHGATDFLPKPYRPLIILHRVAGLIKLRETAAMVNQLQYDRLTGLYTKEYFFEKVRERLRDEPDEKYYIVCSNIENFKLINDTFGTREGDRILRSIADLAKRLLTEDQGFCGRFSGDRFLSLQKQNGPYEWTEKNFQLLSDKIMTECASPMKNFVMRWGIYEIDDPSVSVEQMCDRALLAADSIKNQYHKYYAVYDDSLRSKLLREQKITSVMEEALKEEQFIVYFQPKYSLNDNCMSGAEALVRWIHPEWGFMSPGEFIPLFEKNGFIPKMDEYVWEHVCRKLREWKEKGYPTLPVSVNVSRADVLQGNLVETITGMTKKYALDPAQLHLEITESAYTENPGQIISTVDELRRCGFVIEMDDFGSGYSSLNMLSQMTLDILKLDMKFIQNEIAKSMERSLLSDVISMAHRTHLSVVAEGVETREQMNRLRAVGCDFVQGYFFAKPMPAEEYEKLLQNWHNPYETGAYLLEIRSDIKQSSLLVVDEDAAYRKQVADTFATKFEILEASNIEEAVQYFDTQDVCQISAVILSMTIPDNGAAMMMNVLRQRPEYWEIPVLATIPSSQCAHELPLAMEADDFLCKCHPLFDLRRRVQRMIDMASYRRKEYLLKDEARRDPLTGLLNRRGFKEAIASTQDTDMPMAICLCDVDDMKYINDTLGHDTGDRMLCTFANLLCRKTRAEDIKCRYGGDEFILILKHIGSTENAMKKCSAICKWFQETSETDGLKNACSIGIALCESDKELISEIIDRADQALYRAKKENKGGCCIWEADSSIDSEAEENK